MNVKRLSDSELLSQTKSLVQNERALLTRILHHLREVERRRLFSDLKYQSLFEYAVKELKYSEGQASRRINAMRLMVELPEVEEKMEAGVLSLTTVSQAHSYFREQQKQTPRRLGTTEKLQVLKRLENKSTREAEKVLLELSPQGVLPKERERVISDTHTEVRFVITQALKEKLEQVRALLGPKGATFTFAELLQAMSELSVESLNSKRFGKKRTQISTPAPEWHCGTSPRYISKGLRHQVWTRDGGKCVNCGSQRNLNFDHIKPVAQGGQSIPENLRLLCFHCNQRAAIKIFGIRPVSARASSPAH